MIQAVIFDMDGLLIDSEPLWRQAEEGVLESIGVAFSEAAARETTGMRTDETVHYWYEHQPWKSVSEQEVATRIDNAVLLLIQQEAVAKEGAYALIELCERLRLPMAIASSSSDEIIQAVTLKLGIDQKLQFTYSASNEQFGKPDPAVYRTTARKFGVEPNQCLVFEDSMSGVQAAKAANMRCIAVPASEERTDKRFDIADLIVGSLSEVTADTLQSF